MNVAYNRDCMEAMKEFPDKFFDLAVVDPPYGIDICSKDETPEREREREGEPSSVVVVYSAVRKTQIGGGLLSHPKFITLSTIKSHQMPNIFRS